MTGAKRTDKRYYWHTGHPGGIKSRTARQVLEKNADLFETLHHGDILLHHPFQSFVPVLDFIRTIATDPHA